MKRSVMILAAGQGTRMKSSIPKVLHAVAGAPMVVYPIENAFAAGADTVVLVVGHGRDEVMAQVRARFGDRVRFAVQHTQRGTADAVRAGLAEVDETIDEVLITYGDAPCTPVEALVAVANARSESGAPIALVTSEIDDPTGYGRILRNAGGDVVAIREHKDCTDAERAIRWVNPGLYAVARTFLVEALGAIEDGNAQGEFYLTDLVHIAATRGRVAEVPWAAAPLRGINDRVELAELDAQMVRTLGDRHRRAGVTVDATARIEHGVRIDVDAWIGPMATLRGATHVGARARVDVGCVLEDAEIGDEALLKPYTVVTRSRVGVRAQLGPFAHVRPDSDVGDEAHVGNFVELKKTRLARGAKANHLAYLGDGDVGEGANVGAGTIFCNYDGHAKHRTVVGERAFVGSNSSLVAPVTIGAGAYIGSGSVITVDVPAGALAIGRSRQVNKEGYAERLAAMRKK